MAAARKIAVVRPGGDYAESFTMDAANPINLHVAPVKVFSGSVYLPFDLFTGDAEDFHFGINMTSNVV